MRDTTTTTDKTFLPFRELMSLDKSLKANRGSIGISENMLWRVCKKVKIMQLMTVKDDNTMSVRNKRLMIKSI